MPVAEMQLLVQAGLEPADVLVASTLNSALALGREEELGTLEAGKLADVIIVAGDPLANIAEMAKVEVVIRGGRVVRSAQ